MKKYSVSIFLLFASMLGFCQNNSVVNYEIAKYYNNKKAAVCITFDDGYANQFRKAVPILNEFNYKATFFIITAIMYVPWSCIDSAAIMGHEIASHTVNHNPLALADSIQIVNELLNSQNTINSKIHSQKCLTLAYPNSSYNQLVENIASKYYIGARVSDERYVYYSPSLNFYTLSSWGVTDVINKKIANILKTEKILIENIHGIDNDGYAPIPSELLRNHLSYIKSFDDLLWVAPFQDLIKYMKEKLTAKLISVRLSPNERVYNLIDELPDDLYDFPLSIKLEIPEQWNGIKLVQKYIELKYDIVYDMLTSKKYITFNAVPDKGLIYLSNDTSESYINRNLSFDIYPNPFGNNLNIHTVLPEKSSIRIDVLDRNGNLHYTNYFDNLMGEFSTVAELYKAPNGIYFIKIQIKDSDSKHPTITYSYKVVKNSTL